MAGLYLDSVKTRCWPVEVSGEDEQTPSELSTKYGLVTATDAGGVRWEGFRESAGPVARSHLVSPLMFDVNDCPGHRGSDNGVWVG